MGVLEGAEDVADGAGVGAEGAWGVSWGVLVDVVTGEGTSEWNG